MKESTSESETESSKKRKIDPDFTPRKYAEAKEQVAMFQVTNKRISELNPKSKAAGKGVVIRNEE